MAKEQQETDTDAVGRRRPQADGRGRPREEPRPPTPVCLRFKPWSVGPSQHLGAPTQKTTKASLLSPGRRGGGGEGGGGNFKRLLITSIIDRVSNGVILFISELGVLFKFS